MTAMPPLTQRPVMSALLSAGRLRLTPPLTASSLKDAGRHGSGELDLHAAVGDRGVEPGGLRAPMPVMPPLVVRARIVTLQADPA